MRCVGSSPLASNLLDSPACEIVRGVCDRNLVRNACFHTSVLCKALLAFSRLPSSLGTRAGANTCSVFGTSRIRTLDHRRRALCKEVLLGVEILLACFVAKGCNGGDRSSLHIRFCRSPVPYNKERLGVQIHLVLRDAICSSGCHRNPLFVCALCILESCK